ncbi:MAG TPA: DUF2207 domain-containing protein [Rhizomicrobium sp.]|jgi:uncharacterized membrane protein YgcG|nr:DUF2207 domain-containing protein [Rhizomicrobium sp.]
MTRPGALALALLGLLAAPARADERITDYASDIRVSETGALTVTETISVIADGDQIRHGIFRVIPTEYTDRLGKTVRVGFDALSATRDGHPEPFSVDSVDDGQRIKIGDKDVLVDPGRHVYTLTYATDRQIGFFADYDELYWNVTGNFWKFPIDHAEATIRLPPGARIKQYTAYTGAVGSTGRNDEADKLHDGEIRFSTTQPLDIGEGLTVAVGFSKGAVIPPTAAELRARALRDNAAPIVAAAGILILLIYFSVAWWTHGRDPRRGTIIPLFAPPKDFSPAAVRYVHRMAYDRKSYAASLVDMAVKGYLKISEAHGTYTLTRTGKSAGETALAHGEAAIAGKLFSSQDSIELKQSNHSDVAESISALKSSLKNEYERAYFNTKSAWFIGGLAILGVTAVATALLCDNPGGAAGVLVWLTGWTVGTTFLLHRAFDAWADVFSGPGSRILNAFSALFATAFAIPFAGGLVFGAFLLTQAIAPLATLVLIAGGVASYVFYHLLKAPTLAGAKTFDEIDGFRLFLVTAEKARLEALNPPQVTPQVFERFLPYAIALDCENQWSRKFEAEAAAAGMSPNTSYGGYAPLWYSGASFDRLGAAGFSSALGASMASAAASAATAPGSSSGSSGGGFSGGGGGGGGGGGW